MIQEDQRSLIFVHIGPSLPKHALASYSRAASTWNGPVTALVNRSALPAKSALSFDVKFLEDFYDPKDFQSVSSGQTWGSNFRDGFFRKCLERFFVLHQFAEYSKLDSFFHAESDVLTFDVPQLGISLDALGRGLFVPRDDISRAIGSLVYVNSISILHTFVNFAAHSNQFANEMEALAAFLDAEPDNAHALPTIRQWENPPPTWKTIDPRDVGAIFDSAGLGQWVAGIDPRNTPFLVRNHFVNEKDLISFFDLELRFSAQNNAMTVRASKDGEAYRVANLHVHSKFRWIFSSPRMLALLIAVSNWPIALPLEWAPSKWWAECYKAARRLAIVLGKNRRS